MPKIKTGAARVTVDYGFDVHTLAISGWTQARIEAGEPMTVKGQGFPVEGVMEQDLWSFNFSAVGAIHVSTDTGREVFEGHLGDAEVALQGLE